VYDAQPDIYQDLIAVHQQARAALDPAALDFGANDIIYGGDVDKWRRFSASLQLRLGMRMSEANATLAQSTIADALAAGVFQSWDDAALLPWLDNDNNANPWWSGQTESAGGSRIAATIVDTLKSLNDPRLPVYARTNSDGEYIGMQNGLRDGHGIPFVARSRIGEYFLRRRDTPTVIMGYAEVLFLQAEAAFRGWGPGDAGLLYEQAVSEAMRYYEIPDTAITRYLTEPAVAYNPATGMEQIQLQKWIALFGDSPEAWANWRRTGIPTLVAGPDNVTAGRIPRRMLYPTEEQSLNNANLQAAITRQGGGTNLWDPVWFDPGPTP
jgi:hypothetical protein